MLTLLRHIDKDLQVFHSVSVSNYQTRFHVHSVISSGTTIFIPFWILNFLHREVGHSVPF